MKNSNREANITRRAALLATAYVLATGGLLAAILLQFREEALEAASRELSAFTQLTAGHTTEVLFDVEQALQLAEVTLSVATDANVASSATIQPMLHDVATNARVLKDIVVLDAQGQVLYQSIGNDDVGKNWSDRNYFTRFKADPKLKFDVTTATQDATSAATGWSIPMGHVWNRANGDFGGVVVGFMDPQYLEKVWTFDREIEGLTISLTSRDGAVILRQPLAVAALGKPLIDALGQTDLARSPEAGTLVSQGQIDGRERIFTYHTVVAYPNVMVFVSQPVDVALVNWRQFSLIVGSGWLIASFALAALGFWLAREIEARGMLETRYHTLFDSIPHPVIVFDKQSMVLAYNDAAARQYAWPVSRIEGLVQLPADFDVLTQGRTPFPTDAVTFMEGQRHRNGVGTLIDVDVTVRPIDYNGRSAFLIIAVDVTARKEAERARQAAEDKLHHSQKMEVLGQLTGGIAHDFNNILTVIEGNAESLLDRNGMTADSQKELRQIADSAQRAEELTRQMLAFSRKQPLRPRPTNLNDLVVTTGKLLRRTLGEQVEIDAILADDLWRVDIDRAQLETALVNLCINARDAMPSGGQLLVKTRNTRIDNQQHSRPMPGEYVVITVSDTGTGIPRESINKIFDPFFTTKPSGKGAGLGLSMVYGFIGQSKGHIEVESETGRGTTFRIYLPRCLEAATSMAVSELKALVGGNERVLVVEDDDQVRGSVVRQLRSLGYEVNEAADGTAGLTAFEAASIPYDLLLSDVIMPGTLNGKELADEVVRRWPRTRIVFMSGYTDNAFGDRQVLLLSKPFRKNDLAQILRLALDGEFAATAA